MGRQVHTLRDQPDSVCVVPVLPVGGLDRHGCENPRASGAELWTRRASSCGIGLGCVSIAALES